MYISVIRDVLKNCIGEDLEKDVNSIRENEDLFMLGIDSINLIQLIIGIEDAVGIEFQDDDIDRTNWKTLNKIQEIIIKKKGI